MRGRLRGGGGGLRSRRSSFLSFEDWVLYCLPSWIERGGLACIVRAFKKKMEGCASCWIGGRMRMYSKARSGSMLYCFRTYVHASASVGAGGFFFACKPKTKALKSMHITFDHHLFHLSVWFLEFQYVRYVGSVRIAR